MNSAPPAKVAAVLLSGFCSGVSQWLVSSSALHNHACQKNTRIAQIFRERNVDISTQRLMRAIRLFIKEGEGTKSKASTGQGTATFKKALEEPVTYQIPEAPSALVREEEFAKQLRLARYLAGASLPPTRPLEPALRAQAPKQERTVTKAKSKAKAGPAREKAGEAELAKERRRVQQSGRHKASSGPGRSEKQRSGPSR